MAPVPSALQRTCDCVLAEFVSEVVHAQRDIDTIGGENATRLLQSRLGLDGHLVRRRIDVLYRPVVAVIRFRLRRVVALRRREEAFAIVNIKLGIFRLQVM